jgi:hypothetical protein
MEDGSSIRKTEEEEKEDRELAEKVNATLAEEEKEHQEEGEKKKKQQDQEKKRKGTGQEKGSGTGVTEEEKGQDEACPTFNQTCPDQEPCQTCPEVTKCPERELCQSCLEVKECPPYEECRPCPKVRDCGPCPETKPCVTCEECPPRKECELCSCNQTDVQPPGSGCPDPTGMSVPVALAVGASAGVLLTGIAAAIGLILRYVHPIASGFFLLATVIIEWYLCSQYPETARELGTRATTLLREAFVALGHRVMDALQHHRDQVCFPISSLISSFRLSSKFHLEKNLH